MSDEQDPKAAPSAEVSRRDFVTLSLAAVGDTTEVALSQGEFATQARLELHRDGWSESFERLRKLLAQSG